MPAILFIVSIEVLTNIIRQYKYITKYIKNGNKDVTFSLDLLAHSLKTPMVLRTSLYI